MQLNDAHTAIDGLEATTTVDITSLQAQLRHEQQQNSELRAASREVEWVRREYEHKLAQAQQLSMHARAELEVIRAELDARAVVAEEQDVASGTVVYERSSAVDDYEIMVGADVEDDQLSQAI
jgi:chromosome segregation ATPase